MKLCLDDPQVYMLSHLLGRRRLHMMIMISASSLSPSPCEASHHCCQLLSSFAAWHLRLLHLMLPALVPDAAAWLLLQLWAVLLPFLEHVPSASTGCQPVHKVQSLHPPKCMFSTVHIQVLPV